MNDKKMDVIPVAQIKHVIPVAQSFLGQLQK